MAADSPDVDHLSCFEQDGPIAFAHRGFARGGDENSMAAYQRAVDLGVRYLETDVRVTADGVALAFHDASLDRVTDRAGAVARLPYAEVARARIAGREPIPLLTDLLTAWPDVCLNIDVKSADGIGPTIDALTRTGTVDRVCVAAFSDRRIRALRSALGPRLRTALGPREAIAMRTAAARGRVPRKPVGRFLQVPMNVYRFSFTDDRLIRTAHAVGVPVHVWTVNDPIEMNRLLDLGVDGIRTDRADLLRDVLRERGQWLTPPPT